MSRSPSSGRTVEVFADILCPFTHVGLRNLVARRAELGLPDAILVKAWPLELVNGEPVAASLVADEIAELRAQVEPTLFRGFDVTQFPVTSLPALAVANAAYRRDPRLGEQVSLALRDALFEDGLDVSNPDVLADIGRSYGVRAEPADDVAVIEEWHEGQRRGVAGSPYFFAGGQGFFCPSLEISHDGDDLRITRDIEGLNRFLDAALP
jgi:predicted DsbA family dithiol-disulfide isomerase